MTAHAHDPSTRPSRPGDPGPAAVHPPARRAWPRWLLPAVGAVAIAAVLVALGVVSLSTVTFAGLMGGMVLMHVGGHGGHGGPEGGGPQEVPDSGTPAAGDDHGGHSRSAQPDAPASQTGADPRITTVPQANEEHDHDQHSAHACH